MNLIQSKDVSHQFAASEAKEGRGDSQVPSPQVPIIKAPTTQVASTLPPSPQGILSQEHHRHLIGSGISEAVIAARGYATYDRKSKLAALGYAPNQCIVPTLNIPIWGVNGEILLHHHRPDQPRLDRKRQKLIKYEFQRGAQMHIDVHPHLCERIRDPHVDLYITEGVKKADCAISHGLCCIALLGVWNWRGTNEHGGKTALPDWESIALKGRNVHIAFDSDAHSNPHVHAALTRLWAFLKSRGVKSGVIVGQVSGAKVGHELCSALRQFPA